MYDVNKRIGQDAVESIRVIGIGKAGCSIVNRIVGLRQNEVPAVAVHTHAKLLASSLAPTRLQIGKAVTLGMGAGGDPEIGRRAAEDDADLIRGLFAGTDIAFIVVGLGGGTGTGAAPVLVKAANEAGALALCFVTMPFQFEGGKRRTQAENGLRDLIGLADMTIVVPNERLVELSGGNAGLQEAFAAVDEALSTGICAIWKLVSRPGLISVDYADLRNLARNSGGACALGYGHAAGPDRAAAAANAALACPMLGKDTVAGAAALLVSVIGGAGITVREVNEVSKIVGKAARKDAHMFMGAAIDEDAGDDVQVTIVAAEQGEKPQTEESVTPPDAAQQPAAGGRKQRKQKVLATQPDLDLLTRRKGRFKDVEPTIFDGEDMDVPTFIRRGIFIEK